MAYTWKNPADLATLTRAINQPYGAVIACGPTGSGKTTTLYAALDLLNGSERVYRAILEAVGRFLETQVVLSVVRISIPTIVGQFHRM